MPPQEVRALLVRREVERVPPSPSDEGEKEGVVITNHDLFHYSRSEAKEGIERMNAKEIRERSLLAVENYMGNRGYEVLDVGWESDDIHVDIVARDGDTVVFCYVKVRLDTEKGFPQEPPLASNRERLERAAIAYISENADRLEKDMSVRFDIIGMVVLGDRALIRHHINALSMDLCEEGGW